ncbi:LOW QUALITY PROTEIN: laminin subunit alpha-1-like [Anopheles cruzii]|uniref:LOW QUALITY PROTEIN: laminin subunit alpha-1-like n=1 Tax=Anopheles cruzii TaxID=68878 RepID=UPI0022EC9675|nr:LOW QUALITY PROTEIN: laminin subunit alpha-1-like [Anopheles cruzii]
MCRRRPQPLWRSVLLVLVVCGGVLMGAVEASWGRDDVGVEEMRSLRESRGAGDAEDRLSHQPQIGDDTGDPLQVLPARNRPARLRAAQVRRGPHRQRHSGRQELRMLSGLTVSSATADYEQQLPKASGLWPSFFNVALRATISVNATCGQAGREEYCRITTETTGRSRGSQCGICDANNPDPEKRHPITNIVDGTNSWWQSPTLQKGAKNDRVTINLDLGQLYQIVFFTMRAAISPLPATWVLEKSTDGRTYEPWQYFAGSDGECRERFGLPAYTTNYIFKSDVEVICATQFSLPEPLENGEINLSLISGRPSEKTSSIELQNFTITRYVRIRLLRMQSAVQQQQQHDASGSGLGSVLQPKRSFYSIRSLRIGGRCFCSGHAGKCKANDNNIESNQQEQQQPQCECVHNTCGPHCERCCPLYNQRPYRVGTPVSANKCEKCECHGHATSCYYDKLVDEQHLSQSIRGKMSGGGVCLNCTAFTTGINCERCLPGYYRPEGLPADHEAPCRVCECDAPGATGECRAIGGQCTCRKGFVGPRCTSCAPGHAGEQCVRCVCDPRGTRPGRECGEECSCKAHVVGARCDRCADGFFALRTTNADGCLKCYCSGLVGVRCSAGGQSTEGTAYSTLDGWTVTNLAMGERVVPARDNDTGSLVFGMFEMPDTEAVYWRTPPGYLGNRLASYGSHLTFRTQWITVRGDTSGKPTVGPSLVLVGRNGMKIAYGEASYDEVSGGAVTIEVPLQEQHWYHVPRTVQDIITRLRRTEYHGDPVTRTQYMAVLADVEAILLRGTYHTDQVESVLEDAQLFAGGPATVEGGAGEGESLVERCECPDGYRGASCEECDFGYVRIYETSVTHERVGRCIPCSMCHGHAATCDLETGACAACLHHTVGTNCERCLAGFYGNATVGRVDDCRPCACPLPVAGNNFSPHCQAKGGEHGPGEYVCTQCPVGYTGDHCELCDDGYYGEPTEVGGQCRPCPCHGGPCNPRTGECIECMGFTEGWRCERCKTGYWGVPDDGCEPCSCSAVGALENVCDVTSGQCICKPRYGGRRCDECDVGYGNLELECPACACHVNGSSSAAVCSPVSGQCECNPGTTGLRCDRCEEGYFGLSPEQPDACQGCNCHPKGAHGPACSHRTGQCQCRPNIDGRQCNLCRKGHWNLDSGEGCVACSCDANGSELEGCDVYTGQCFCKTGVEGIGCDRCQTGYYGFSAQGCKRCEQCASPAFVCDPDTGRCVCPANSHGTECRSCIANTWGNEFQRGCRQCACDIVGSIGQSCDKQDGQCSCKEGYTGRQCAECAEGYYGYPACRRCGCDERGTITNGTTYPCDRNGQCACKELVYGAKCDQCRQGTFGLVALNPEGCTRCFCFGRASECALGEHSWGQIRLKGSRNLSVEYREDERPASDGHLVDYLVFVELTGGRPDSREGANITNMNNLDLIPGSTGNVSILAHSAFRYPLYFQLPYPFLGDRTSSYGGLLNFTLVTGGASVAIAEPSLRQFPLVQLHTHENLVLDFYEDTVRSPDQDVFSVRLFGSRWRNHYDGSRANRTILMTALQNVRHVFVRATTTVDFQQVVLTNVTLDEGIFVAGAENNHAYSVEQCSCGAKFSGLSCQNPGRGHYRHRLPIVDLEWATVDDMIGQVLPCGCNGRSEECDPETGVCVNCRNNTGGEHCERCAEGFYGDPNAGQCSACPCPETRKNFARGCTVRGSDVHCVCKPGYTGALCDSCMRGYFGQPHLDQGHCEGCECNREGSMSDECDRQTGECHCRPGVVGRRCDRCELPKHIVKDYRCKVCDNCTVTLMDDFEILSSRLDEETAHIDRHGIPAPWVELTKYEARTRQTADRVARLLQAEDTIKQFAVDFAEPLKRNATRLGKRLVKLDNRATNRAGEVVKCTERVDELADEIGTIDRELRAAIRTLQNYGVGDHHIKLPLAVREANDLLANIRERFEGIEFDDGVGECAQRQYDHWANVSRAVDRQAARLDDTKFEIEQLHSKAGHLQNYTVHVFRGVQETEVYQSTNQKHLERIRDAYGGALESGRDVKDLLDTNILAGTASNLEQLDDNYGQLAQDNGTLAALVELLNESTEDLTREKNILLETRIPQAVRHAEQLKTKADHFRHKFQSTEDASAKAMEASQAYENIIGAIVAAQESADNATNTVEKADQLIHPLHDVTITDQSERALEVSTNLTTRAAKELAKATALNETMIGKEKSVQSLKDQIWQTAIKNNNLMDEVGKVERGATMKTVQADLDRSSIVSEQMKFVRQDAINLNSDVYKLKLKLKSLEPEWDTKFGLAEENVSQTFGNIRKAKDKLNGIEGLAKTQAERFRTWNRTFAVNLQDLRDRIARAKHAAEGIRVSMESTAACIRSYAPASFGPSTTNRIVMSIALTDPTVQSTPLVYIEGDERRFIALELRQRKVRLLWSLDGTVTEVTHPQEIEVRDLKKDDAWYFIDASRTFNLGTLTVRRMQDTGVLTGGRTESKASSPVAATLNVGPSHRVWVGGIPDDLRVPELEPVQGLGVAVSQLYVDQRQIGLWHFTSTSGTCAGAMLGPQEVASSTGERNFNGNGYAVLQRASPQPRLQFSLSLSFKTLDEDALIFLALDEENNRSVSLTLYQGRLMFRVDYGDDTRLEINTTKRYNTGSWVVVEASRQFRKSSTDEGVLKVNSEPVILGSPTKPIGSAKLPVLSDTYYLGGVPPGFKTGTTKAPGADHAFLGCVKGLQISGVSYDPLGSTSHFGIEASCDSTITKAGFFGNGYLELPSFTLKKRSHFGFVFRTMQPDCLLLLSAYPSRIRDDYDAKDRLGNYSVFLSEGRVNLWMDGGAGRIELVSNGTLNDGEYHVLAVVKQGRHVELRIDDQLQSARSLQPSLVTMPGESGGLFIGGVPDDPAFDTLAKVFDGLEGTVANLVFNNRTVSFGQALNFSNVQMGRTGPPMGSQGLYTALMKTEPIGRSFKAAPEGCHRVGSYSYEPNAFKYGDKPQSYSVVMVPARNIWQRNFHIEFDFRTFYPNGILFVALGTKEKAKHFIMLALKDGVLRLTVRGRKREHLLLPPKLNDGQWHHVTLSSVRKKATLSVQIGSSHSSAQIKLPKKLNAANALHVGGLPDEVPVMPRELQPKPEEFKGCLRKFSVNNNTQDLARPGRHLNVGQCFPRIEQGSYFPGDAYAIYKRNFNVGKFVEIELEVRTSETNGILMSVADQINGFPALSLEISNGNIILSVDNGDGNPTRLSTTLPSKYTLCDNRWHNISGLYEDHQIVLRVDEHPPSVLLPHGTSSFGRVNTKAPLYIGGLPDAASSGTLLMRENFKGCIRNIVIRNERKDWTDMDDLHNVLLSECLAVS